ncbi:hypothetical protein [Roseibium sp. RKSG952]|uniref:hypothetical protein n=1 Tax=Roseibium sp. RKSG952 TaxID=2529384 RepID=UPI0012BC76CD|nr:hypothetical protein [Roseibium sp. RKSG952]MTH95426.1 hypothetical protein [Roseibium sp. RKSG952]
MFGAVYNLLDKKRRPLRHHTFMVFPEIGIAYGRIPGDPFLMALPIITALKGGRSVRAKHAFNCASASEVWQSDVELLTAREYVRKYPGMPTFSFIQSPLARIVSCYENVILGDMALPAYFEEKRFVKSMPIAAFAAKVAALPDLHADNLIRSQTAILSYRNKIIPDLLIDIDGPANGLAELARLLQARGHDLAELTQKTAPSSRKTLMNELVRSPAASLLHRRYANDGQLFATVTQNAAAPRLTSSPYAAELRPARSN